jgi:hypothetical protein
MDLTPLPYGAGLDEYQKKAEDLLAAIASSDPNALQLIRQFNPRLPGRAHTNERDRLTDSEIRSVSVTLADAQCVVAGCCGFESWSKVAEFAEAVSQEGTVNLTAEERTMATPPR